MACSFARPQTLTLVRSFTVSIRPCGPRTAATTTSADFSLRLSRRPFRHKARSPQVRVAHLHRTTAAFTPPRLGHKSFAVMGLLALLGNAFYAVLVHRLTIYAPRFLPTLGRPHAVALHFAHCDQLAAGLAPAGVRPCWAHPCKRRCIAAPFFIFRPSSGSWLLHIWRPSFRSPHAANAVQVGSCPKACH